MMHSQTPQVCAVVGDPCRAWEGLGQVEGPPLSKQPMIEGIGLSVGTYC